MRILFAGSPRLAVPSLEAVCAHYPVVAVLTNPDRPSGRGGRLEATAVKGKALELGLPLLQPETLDSVFLEAVRELKADLLVVVAFGKIFKKDFLDLFSLGAINVHASLLPKFRGCSPISAAILAGERETGVTVQKLALKMDAGDVLGVRRIPLSGKETSESLSDTLSTHGAELLVTTLKEMEKDTLKPVPQDEEQATYCRLVGKEDGKVDWSREAEAVERMIRAYDPWPRAFTFYRGRRLNLLAGGVFPEPMDTTGMPEGLVLAFDNRYGILVNTGGGVLCLTKLQLQAKKPMHWRSFLNGQKDFIGSRLGEQL